MTASPAYILVVDDDADLRPLLQRILTGAGYEVALADSPAAAHDAIGTRKPDLLIADINMPGTDGIEMVARVREDPALARLPVIYLTGLEEDSELAVKTVGFPLLAKPVRSGELLATVADQLRT